MIAPHRPNRRKFATQNGRRQNEDWCRLRHQRAVEFPKRWIAIVAQTPADARDYMIEGPGLA